MQDVSIAEGLAPSDVYSLESNEGEVLATKSIDNASQHSVVEMDGEALENLDRESQGSGGSQHDEEETDDPNDSLVKTADSSNEDDAEGSEDGENGGAESLEV